MHGTANFIIYTRCFRTGHSITCSSIRWGCSLEWKIKNSNLLYFHFYHFKTTQKKEYHGSLVLGTNITTNLDLQGEESWLLNLLLESDPWSTLGFLFKNWFGVIFYISFLLPRKQLAFISPNLSPMANAICHVLIAFFPCLILYRNLFIMSCIKSPPANS